MILFIWHSLNDNIMEMENRFVVKGLGPGWGWGRGEGGRCGYKRTPGIFMVMELFYILTISVVISWLWYCTIVLENVLIGGNWAKCRRHLTALFLTTVCGSTIISVKNSIKNSNAVCHWCWDYLLWCPYTNCKMRKISTGDIFTSSWTF